MRAEATRAPTRKHELPDRPSVHAFCGVPVASGVVLPELPSSAAAAQIRFHLAPTLPLPQTTAGARHVWRAPDGGISLSLFKSDRYNLLFPGTVRFAIGADGRDIVGCGDCGHTDDVRHALLTQVLPRVLSLRGRMVVHASAVIGSEGAIAVLGTGGAGKSTLAAAFQQAGHEVIADDCLVLQPAPDAVGFLAIPGPPGVRLCRDAAAGFLSPDALAAAPEDPAGKVRIASESTATRPPREPARLARAVLLQPWDSAAGGSEVEVEALTPAEALMAFVEHSFQLELWDRTALSARLRAFAAVADAVPVVRIRFRHDLREIATLRECVLSLPTTASRLATAGGGCRL